MTKINYGNKDVFKEFSKTLDESVKDTYGPILLRAVQGNNGAMFKGMGTPDYEMQMDSILREHNETFNAEVIPQSLDSWGCMKRYATEQKYLEMVYYDYMNKSKGIKSSAELAAYLKKINPVRELLVGGDAGAIKAIRQAKLDLLGGVLSQENVANRVQRTNAEKNMLDSTSVCRLARERDLRLYKLAKSAMWLMRRDEINLHLLDEAQNPLDYELLVNGSQSEMGL